MRQRKQLLAYHQAKFDAFKKAVAREWERGRAWKDDPNG